MIGLTPALQRMAGVKPIKEHASDRGKMVSQIEKKLLKESFAQRRKDAEEKAIRFNLPTSIFLRRNP